MLKQAANSGAVSLKGSAEVLVDYFFYAVNSILYQRGVYPEASFKKDVQYELSVLVAADEGLIKYLSTILAQIKEWIMAGALQKLVLVIKCVKTEEVLERWQFNIVCETPDTSGEKTTKKSLNEIQEGIRNVIRQIVSINTILPVLSNSCTFIWSQNLTLKSTQFRSTDVFVWTRGVGAWFRMLSRSTNFLI
ncbi:Spindle checkpoint complex subunit [Fasciolopsis buskii]|uniref:Spindle checkpoint complex subunit n=1 Tax=Fasciolopsis buskii TaxID=27845 RepID=A0A8E0S138_9TREM|nr:Spindle checkpoint complex subunit [Fasciolopsis buski]